MIFVVVIEGIPVHAFFMKEDAMAYISEILDLNTRENSSFGGNLHEDVIVPYAGFFDSGFFF